MSTASPFDRLVSALDGTRRATLALALRSRLAAFVLRDRGRRIEARAAFAIVGALALSIVAPAFMLAVGPLVFGVPHVASELRYLVVRRGLRGRWLVALVVGCALVSGLRVVEQHLRLSPICAVFEIGLAIIGVLGAAIAGARDRSPSASWRLAIVAPIFAALGTLALRHALLTRLLFVHLHNFGAILLWIVVFRRQRGLPVVALGLLAIAVALLVSGVTVPWSASLGGLSAAGVDLAAVGSWLLPGAALSVAIPLTLVHAFSDSVHYATWLTLIPEEEIRSAGSLTFRMTARSLMADFGMLGVAAVTVAMLVVACASAADMVTTRRTYFAIAGFHGYVELAIIVFLVVRGDRETVAAARIGLETRTGKGARA